MATDISGLIASALTTHLADHDSVNLLAVESSVMSGVADSAITDFNANNDAYADITVPSLTVRGLTGATVDTRRVGATSSDYPASGTFQANDIVVSAAGEQSICTTGGSPGTWTRINPWRYGTTLSAAANTVTVSNIPSNLQVLRAFVYARSDTTSTTYSYIRVRLNGDSSTIYHRVRLNIANTTVSPGTGVGQTGALAGVMPSDGGNTGLFGACSITIPDWSQPHGQSCVTILSQAGCPIATSGTANLDIQGTTVNISGPLTSISFDDMLGNNFVAGSTFHILGY